MKLVFIFLSLFLFCITSSSQSDPPKPVENSVYDMFVGEWTGESVMMNNKMGSVVKCNWDFNHQFLVMNYSAKGTDNPAITYKAVGFFGIDASGNSVSWWFDDWGAGAVTMATGKFGEKSLTMNEANPWYSATRTFTFKSSNEVEMYAKGKMNMGGQEIPFEETVVFRKN